MQPKVFAPTWVSAGSFAKGSSADESLLLQLIDKRNNKRINFFIARYFCKNRNKQKKICRFLG